MSRPKRLILRAPVATFPRPGIDTQNVFLCRGARLRATIINPFDVFWPRVAEALVTLSSCTRSGALDRCVS